MTLTTRIEAAEVPTRELFEEAFEALNPVSMCWDAGEGEAYTNRKVRFDRMLDAEAWTSAAEMLVPEGWDWLARSDKRGGFANLTDKDYVQAAWSDDQGRVRMAQIKGRSNPVYAAHPSLALLAAILRAERKDDE